MSVKDKRYYVYILSNASRTLYIGVTSDLQKRLQQHREGAFEGFTSQYNVDELVYLEDFNDVNEAIAREKQLKKWRREKKLELIRKVNPMLKDLSKEWQ